MKRSAPLAALLALLLAAAAVAPVAAATPSPTDGATAPPADPETDVLGWEDGYWYNESVSVTRSDGLNDTELDAVVSRAMARVEEVRRLEFAARPPVEVIGREAYADRIAGSFENVSTEERLFHDTLAEARFFAGEGESWTATLRELSAGGVGGFYSPSEERIVVVSENTTTPRLNEIVLAQELMHALQFDFAENRSFGLTDEYEAAFGTGRMTTDRHNAYDAVIEGDGNYVDYIYRQRCDGSWDCLTVEQAGGAGAVYDAGEWGAILTQYAPYSDGPSFVREVYREGGWEAVNALYRNPVESTEQLVHPERYPDDAPRAVALDDRSGGAWERLVPPANGSLGGLPGMNASHDTFGEAGMVSMFVAPGFPGGTETVFRRDAFLTGDDFDPYDYRFEATTGWDGDRIEVYVTDDSAATNETGYVWRSVWDSPADAAAFADAYRELLSVRNARPVAGAEDVYVVLDAGREPSFADAFALRVENDTVTVVNAPTLDALNGVRAGTVPDGLTRPTPTPTPTPYDFSTATVTPTATGTETAEATATATETPGQPGFGALAVVTALAALVGLFGRRRA